MQRTLVPGDEISTAVSSASNGSKKHHQTAADAASADDDRGRRPKRVRRTAGAQDESARVSKMAAAVKTLIEVGLCAEGMMVICVMRARVFRPVRVRRCVITCDALFSCPPRACGCCVWLQCMGEDPSREGLAKTPVRAAKALLFFTKVHAPPFRAKACATGGEGCSTRTGALRMLSPALRGTVPPLCVPGLRDRRAGGSGRRGLRRPPG